MMLTGRRGQQISEYAVMLGVVIMAAMAAQRYVTRSVAGGLRSASAQILGTNYADTAGNVSGSSSTTQQTGQPGQVQVVNTSSNSGSASSGFLIAHPYNPSVGTFLPNPESSMEAVAVAVASFLAEEGEVLFGDIDSLEVGEDGWVRLSIKGQKNRRDRDGKTRSREARRSARFKVNGVSVVDGVWVADVEIDEGDGKSRRVTLLGLPEGATRGLMMRHLDKQRTVLRTWLSNLEDFAESLREGEGPLESMPADERADLLAAIQEGVRDGKDALRKLDSKDLSELSFEDLESAAADFGEVYQEARGVVATVNGVKEAGNEAVQEQRRLEQGEPREELLEALTLDPHYGLDSDRNEQLWSYKEGELSYSGEAPGSAPNGLLTEDPDATHEETGALKDPGWLIVDDEGKELLFEEPSINYGSGYARAADNRWVRARMTVDRLEDLLDDEEFRNEGEVRELLASAKEQLDDLGMSPSDMYEYAEPGERHPEKTREWIAEAKETLPKVGEDLDEAYRLLTEGQAPPPEQRTSQNRSGVKGEPTYSLFEDVQQHPVNSSGEMMTFDDDSLPDYQKDRRGHHNRMHWQVATEEDQRYLAHRSFGAAPAVEEMPVQPITVDEVLAAGKSPAADQFAEPHLWIPEDPSAGGNLGVTGGGGQPAEPLPPITRVPISPRNPDDLRR